MYVGRWGGGVTQHRSLDGRCHIVVIFSEQELKTFQQMRSR